MIESKFIEISELFNCTYQKKDFKVDGEVGSKVHISIYTLKLYYKDNVIDISYEFGNHNLAEVNIKFEYKNLPKLDVRTRDNFTRLFSFNKSPWKIACKNKLMSSNINEILKVSKLNKMANEACFEPIISGKMVKNSYFFNTKFSLAFDNKEDSLLPIIEFHKIMIDLINEGTLLNSKFATLKRN